jgi:hypothetical protein
MCSCANLSLHASASIQYKNFVWPIFAYFPSKWIYCRVTVLKSTIFIQNPLIWILVPWQTLPNRMPKNSCNCGSWFFRIQSVQACLTPTLLSFVLVLPKWGPISLTLIFSQAISCWLKYVNVLMLHTASFKAWAIQPLPVGSFFSVKFVCLFCPWNFVIFLFQCCGAVSFLCGSGSK